MDRLLDSSTANRATIRRAQTASSGVREHLLIAAGHLNDMSVALDHLDWMADHGELTQEHRALLSDLRRATDEMWAQFYLAQDVDPGDLVTLRAFAERMEPIAADAEAGADALANMNLPQP